MSKRRIYSPEEIKEKLTPLFRDAGLGLVLLFGSQGSGRIHPESDIDLAFLYEEPVDLLHLSNRVTDLLHTDGVDVIDLRRANPLVCFSAVSQGKVLYERIPGQFRVFYSLSFRRYVDTKKLREARIKAIERFIEERGLG